MTTPLSILIVEDSPDDADLMVAQLRQAGFDPQWRRVETEPDFLAELKQRPDIVLSDYSLPQFTGLRAAQLVRESGLDIPFILVSGTVGEEAAVEAMKHGATDYLLKDRIARLGNEVERALEQKRLHAECQQTVAELRWKTALLEAQLDASIDGILVVDNHGQKILQNQRLNQLWKIPPLIAENKDDAVQIEFVSKLTKNPHWFKEQVACLYSQPDAVSRDEIELVDGSILDRYSSPIRDQAGNNYGRIWNFRDITDRKRAETAMRWLAAIVESSDDAIIGHDLNGLITSWNGGAEKIFGYTASEAVGTSILRLVPADRQPEEGQTLNQIKRGESVEQLETVRQTKDGRLIHVSVTVSPIKDAAGKAIGVSKVARDITMQKAHEHEIVRLSRLYAALTQINQAIVTVPNREELLARICRGLVEAGGFRMAWVGWLDVKTRQVSPVAQWGDHTNYLSQVIIYADDRPEGRELSGTAIRKERNYICNDFLRDPITLPWRESAIRSGFRASAAFLIRQGGAVCGTITVYSEEIDFFQDQEITLLAEAADDVSFALDNFAREAARQRAEQAVLHERDFSDAALNSLPGVFYMFDRNGKNVRWNKNLEQITGYTADEIAPMHPLDFFTGAEQERVAARISEVFQNGASSVEANIVAKDGRAMPYYFTGVRIQIDGQTCLLGVGLDVTERKQAEDALRSRTAFFEALVDSTLDGILVLDSGGKKVIQNCQFRRMFKIPDDSVCDLDELEMIRQVAKRVRNRSQFAERMIHIKSHPDEIGHYEIEMADGTVLERYHAPVRDKTGKNYGRIWTFRDITERRKLEEQFRQAQKLEGIGQLAGGVAHDFNNMLATIQMNVDLLRMDSGITRAQFEIAQEIGAAVQRATALTRQLLLFSRKQTMQLRDLDLNESISDMTKMLRRSLGEAVQLQFKFAMQPLLLHADAGMLDQVLLNLAVNARDAMPEGGRLAIETSAMEFDEALAGQNPPARPGSFVCLSVSDTGSGIPPEILPRIFEPFFTTKEVGKGTGLGLATVFGIVQQHQGWINVYSEVGHGTTFRIYLPRLAGLSQAKPEEPALTGLRGGNETILFVEDELSLHDSVRKVLSRARS